MIQLILTYFNTRLRLIEWMALSVLFCLLVFDLATPEEEWTLSVLFLWSSFLVFRMLDDLGSVKIDAKDHPERIYVEEGKSRQLFNVFGAIGLCYAAVWNFVGYAAAYIIDGFILLSFIIYLIFPNNRLVIRTLPFLKYPLLVLSISGFILDYQHALLASGVLLMMLAYDAIETGQKKLSIVLLALAGTCFFYSWPLALIPVMILLPLALLYLPFDHNRLKYLPILYFPIAVFVYESFFNI